MFYDKYRKLCGIKGVSVSKAAEDIGLSRTTVVKWKNGSIPSGATVQKLATYFGVSVDYLLSEENNEGQSISITGPHNTPLVLDDETLHIIEELRYNPNMKKLLEAVKDATPEDIAQAVKVINALKDRGGLK